MNTARSDYDVVILGAGLVGMALAFALARHGFAVALLERSALAAFEGWPEGHVNVILCKTLKGD